MFLPATFNLGVVASPLSVFDPDLTFPTIQVLDTEAEFIDATYANNYTIVHAKDTDKLYVWEDDTWYIYNNDSIAFPNTNSVSFDGTNDYIDLGTSSTLNPTSSLTLSTWIYINGAGTGSLPTIYNSSKTSNGISGGIALAYTSNKIRFYLDTTGSSGWVYAESNSTLSTGQWYHLVGTWDGSTVTLYIDGTAQSTTASASTIGYNTGTPAYIGRYSTNYFEGLIDEVALFNSALSVSDITSIYNSGVPADITSLSPLGWWRMGDNDGGTGTTITDQGSGGNNGTLTNGPTFSTTVPS